MCETTLASLKKSPIHLAIMRTIMTGRPKDIPCVASIRIAVRLIVILTTPPSCAAAPSKAYLPGSNTTCNVNPWNCRYNSLFLSAPVPSINLPTLISLTQSGQILERPEPINLPHADPISREGMKRPLDIDRPKVAAARKKYSRTKMVSVTSL